MEFREFSGGGWELIKPLMPPKDKTGRPRADDKEGFAMSSKVYPFIFWIQIHLVIRKDKGLAHKSLPSAFPCMLYFSSLRDVRYF